jgi:hypothetical protein
MRMLSTFQAFLGDKRGKKISVEFFHKTFTITTTMGDISVVKTSRFLALFYTKNENA